MTPEEKAILGFTRRLENLAKSVLPSAMFADKRFENYLDTQEKIFQLQMDLQRAIGQAKKSRDKSAESRSYLENLRNRRWLARRLGDALAWNGLLHNRQVMQSLRQNSPVPVPSAWSDGHRGTFEFAKNMTGPAWGVPIVHDVTSILRVGDITFMLPLSPAPRDAVYRTVELKTTRVGESTNENGESVVNIHVTAVANEPLPMRVPSAPDGQAPEEPEGPEGPEKQRRPDRRMARQLERMDIATASKNVPMHQLTKVGDQHVFSFALEDEQQPHWKELRRAIRAARRDGFAYFELGGFVGYSLVYNSEGVSVEDIKAAPIPDHFAGLMHAEITERNSLTVSALPDGEDDSFSAQVLPLYLWEVPQRAIRDILRHRLMITAAYNTAWMEKLLTDAGLTVIPRGSARDQRDFEVVAHFTWEGEARVEYHSSVWEEMYVAVHEFRGPNAVVQRALVPTSAPATVSLDKFLPAEGGEPVEATG